MTTETPATRFDSIRFVREARARIHEETKDMSSEEFVRWLRSPATNRSKTGRAEGPQGSSGEHAAAGSAKRSMTTGRPRQRVRLRGEHAADSRSDQRRNGWTVRRAIEPVAQVAPLLPAARPPTGGSHSGTCPARRADRADANRPVTTVRPARKVARLRHTPESESGVLPAGSTVSAPEEPFWKPRIYADPSVFRGCEDEVEIRRKASRRLFEDFRAGRATLVTSPTDHQRAQDRSAGGPRLAARRARGEP